MIQKLFAILFLSIITICSADAQGPRNKMSKEDFKERQQKYFMEKSGITEEEATQFFPIYYELQDKKAAINNKVWGNVRKNKDQNLSEKEYSDLITHLAKAKIASDELDLEYIPKFKKIISAKKLFKLQIAEMSFHRDMLKIMHRQPPKNN